MSSRIAFTSSSCARRFCDASRSSGARALTLAAPTVSGAASAALAFQRKPRRAEFTVVFIVSASAISSRDVLEHVEAARVACVRADGAQAQTVGPAVIADAPVVHRSQVDQD